VKYRIAAVSVLCLVLGLVLTWKVHGFVARSAMDEAELQAGTTLRLAVSALDGHLKRYEALPALTADDEIIEVLIEDPGNEALRLAANRYLKSVNALLKSSDIYIMTMDGTTIAASNYDSPVSFVGENFSYRPYFQEAARGERSRFFAVGTTSAKRGYYFSSPIVMDGKILGVIVFKVDLDTIEASWAGGDDRIFVSDPEGIIFMTGSDEWRFAAILPLTPDRIARTETSRRYADVKLHQLPLAYGSFAGHETMLIRNGNTEREYLYVSQSMPEAGWTVNVLMDTASVRWQAQTMMAAVFLAFCLAGLVSAIVFQRRARLTERMQLQAEAQNELERRVDERTAALARVNSRIEKEIAERRLTERR